MLFENVRVHPIELMNNLTGQIKILLPGEIMDLPEAFGKLYYNYLKPVVTEAVDTELFVEDIQSEIVSEFNMSSDISHPESLEQLDLFSEDNSKDGLFVEKEEKIETRVENKSDENVLVVEEEKKEKGKKGRPKVYEDVSAAEKRKIQRQKKKENDAKFKDLKF
jgi:hypothetical protein